MVSGILNPLRPAPAALRGPQLVDMKAKRREAKAKRLQILKDGESVEVFTVDSILTKTFGADYPANISYDRQTEFMKRWCKNMGASYYCHEKNHYSDFDARSLAVKEGNRRVVVEDMS